MQWEAKKKLCKGFFNKIVLTQKSVIILTEYNVSNQHMIVIMKKDIAQVTIVHKARLTIYEKLVTRDTGECPLSVLRRLILEKIHELSVGTSETVRYIRVSVLSRGPKSDVPLQYQLLYSSTLKQTVFLRLEDLQFSPSTRGKSNKAGKTQEKTTTKKHKRGTS